MSPTLLLIVVIVEFIGLILLTIFFMRLSSHYGKFLKGADKRTLQAVLDTLVQEQKDVQKDIALLRKRCDTIEQDGKLHIQKIGLIRFNPFRDTGGDQSFILALLDGNERGIVISGLYARSGTRWYAKKVANGKGIEHELSEEEKKAMKEAHGHGE